MKAYVEPEEFFEQYELEPETPLYKKVLCGNNPLGDWHHLFWKGLDCVCCGFYRGMLLGFAYSAIGYAILKLIGW